MYDTGTSRQRARLHGVGPAAAEGLRGGRPLHAAVPHELLPEADKGEPDERCRSTAARPPLLRRLVGFNLLSAVVLARSATTSAGGSATRSTPRASTTSVTRARTTSRSSSRTSSGVIGLPRRARASQLPALAHGRTPGRSRLGARKRRDSRRGWTRYIGFSTDHKVVGLQYLIGIGFFIFFGGVNAMLIRFELLRPDAERVPGGPVPDARRPARHDDDGDDDERDPRPVRQLLPPAHDRRPAPRVPAHRGVHVLAPDGRRASSSRPPSSTAGSRPAGRATRRSTTRRTWAWTRTSCSSRSSGSR